MNTKLEIMVTVSQVGTFGTESAVRKRGEKGIQIIAPTPVKEKQEIEKIDPDTQEPIIGEDGQPETEIVKMYQPLPEQVRS